MLPIRFAKNREVSFRDERPADQLILRKLYRTTRENELAQTGWREEDKQAFVEMQFKAQQTHYRKHYPEAQWLVVELEGVAIGRLYIEDWECEIRIIDIAIVPEIRGQGIGSALIRQILRQGDRQVKKVGIHVEKNNPAMSLYKRLGFALCEDKGVYDLLKWAPTRSEVSNPILASYCETHSKG
ncbi:Mycothiol acetyltransferase [Pseudovibrio sp. Ad13]|uniref:GNAT family N-acetyltransferase n=1 Tax=Pseudovibrio sp. Ad13 TaxID=989396 RepID=UPI0007AEA488|nr:GNAT family N-acetyltransferase [Pseudovibrio sp. Ad13]KZK84507.1 Mycothiol acetyltransferase [Pseudovibrio sp. Ad13]